MYKFIPIVLLLFGILMNISGCSFFVNEDDDTESSNYNYESVSYKIEKSQEGKTLNEYYFSLDGSDYIVEKNEIISCDEMDSNGYMIYHNGSEQELKVNNDDWSIELEKNLSATPAIWLTNEEVIINGQYIYNTKTGSKDKIKLPFEYFTFANRMRACSINKGLNKLAYIIVDGPTEEYPVGIYDLENDIWETIYSTPRVAITEAGNDKSKFVASIKWDIEDNVYFTHNIIVDDDSNMTIKKYNSTTKMVEDYMIDAAVLTISSDLRYLTVLDVKGNKTKIIDVIEGTTFEIPITFELDWHSGKNQFAYIDPQNTDYIYINTITNNNEMIENKVAISNLRNDDEGIRNIQYVGNEIRFDVVKYNRFEDGYIKDIKNATTYVITEDK